MVMKEAILLWLNAAKMRFLLAYSVFFDIIELNRPRMGLYIPTMVWKDMYDFSEDSVLLVLASEHYDADEYIRDYDEYVAEMRIVGNEAG